MDQNEQRPTPQRIYYGAAYYDEYMPASRVEEDMVLMEQAGMNLIRIAESTWSTWEPREGEFDFASLHRVLDGARRHNISVIVGTPTYAIPPWLARKYPDILAETHAGLNRYGSRQNMDITHPGYRKHCEIIIRRLLDEVRPYENVIGFQLDNETKPYDTCGPRVQAMFLDWLREKFGTVEAMNKAYGLAYWSNSLGCWEDMPDVRGTICGSLAAEFEAFQRHLVTDFLHWQRSIVDEYRRPDQFVTHNFDFDWKGCSYGLQPNADHFAIRKGLTTAGCDIYHRSGGELTGVEAAFCGDLIRGVNGGENFQVLETQAQGNTEWLPYPGQLRLQAFSLLASGAELVEYWHWHSIHNGIENYWKGVLSHDFTPGAIYQEVCTIGKDFSRLGNHLTGFQRKSQVAILVSNRSLTGIRHSATPSDAAPSYNDCLRWLYDGLFRLNISCDILPDTVRIFDNYDLVVVPCLYCAGEELIKALQRYVENGGHLLASFRSFFTDENLQISHAPQPCGMTDVFGLTYDNFTVPRGIPDVSGWMELLRPVEDTETLAVYGHPAYQGYAAATLHQFGRGSAAYLGTMFCQEKLEALLERLLPAFGISIPALRWPITVRKGVNSLGRRMWYLLNYSAESHTVSAPEDGVDLLSGKAYSGGAAIELEPWGAAIMEMSLPNDSN